MEIRTRSYSIGNEDDNQHTSNGRCPTYALRWNTVNNQHHWPPGHDYYLGNGENITDGTLELRKMLSERLAQGLSTTKILYCDLDGVLADFDKGIEMKFKKPVSPGLMWGTINKSRTFFEELPWMPKGRELWDTIKQYHPVILTGIPNGNKTATEQKKRWCARELGPDVQVITCLTKEKANYCLSESILLDDRPNNKDEWINRGGKFILYNEERIDDILEELISNI